MCTNYPLIDAIAASVRMLEFRGAALWQPAGEDVTALPRIAALLSPHAREHHRAGCVYRAVDGSALVVVTDIDRLAVGPVRQAAEPAFLASTLKTEGGAAVELHLVAAAVPNTQTLKMLPANATVVPWTLVLTYPLDHEIVPPHRRATPADLRAAGLSRCKPGLLPAVRSDDPVVRYLHLRVGEIVRIDRQDGSLYFRRVISPPTMGAAAGPAASAPIG